MIHVLLLATHYVATTGSDAGNDCTNQATPCATIAAGIASMASGDTLVVGDGTYAESIAGMPSGSAGAHTTIQAQDDCRDEHLHADRDRRGVALADSDGIVSDRDLRGVVARLGHLWLPRRRPRGPRAARAAAPRRGAHRSSICSIAISEENTPVERENVT
jgi:hypothetical protein